MRTIFTLLKIRVPSKSDPLQFVFNYKNPLAYVALIISATIYGIYGFIEYFIRVFKDSLEGIRR